jgi:hypothetical protein
MQGSPARAAAPGQWAVTDRGSWFWCGQRWWHEPGYDWRVWLAAQWEALALPPGMARSGSR